MPFASDDLRYLYDKLYSGAEEIGTNPDAEPDDQQVEADVKALIRWRKGESDYPFPKARRPE